MNTSPTPHPNPEAVMERLQAGQAVGNPDDQSKPSVCTIEKICRRHHRFAVSATETLITSAASLKALAPTAGQDSVEALLAVATALPRLLDQIEVALRPHVELASDGEVVALHSPFSPRCGDEGPRAQNVDAEPGSTTSGQEPGVSAVPEAGPQDEDSPARDESGATAFPGRSLAPTSPPRVERPGLCDSSSPRWPAGWRVPPETLGHVASSLPSSSLPTLEVTLTGASSESTPGSADRPFDEGGPSSTQTAGGAA